MSDEDKAKLMNDYNLTAEQLKDYDTVYNLYKQYGQAWIKKNLEVRAYAFTLSDGENFALFQNAEDFLTACAMFNVKRVFWYNAKSDFAIFDYYLVMIDIIYFKSASHRWS